MELTLSGGSDINIPFLIADATGPKHLNSRISRSKFESLIDPILTKLQKLCEKFKKEIPKDIIVDEIILVGGISRIPVVQEIVKKVFGKEPLKSINPEEVPVLGSAIIASKLKDVSEKIKTLQFLPLSIGVETLGGTFCRIIPRSTAVPFKIKKTFTTASDNQANFNLKLYMGEREIAAENKLLGDINLVTYLAKKGIPQVNVTFSLNENGDLFTTAQEVISRKSMSKLFINLIKMI